MASETPKRASMWSFPQAPPEFRALFPKGGEGDWLVYVPQGEREILEPSLLRWQRVYPVTSTELTDQSMVYWGAPRDAMLMIAQQHRPIPAQPPAGTERRAAVRVKIECPSRYE